MLYRTLQALWRVRLIFATLCAGLSICVPLGISSCGEAQQLSSSAATGPESTGVGPADNVWATLPPLPPDRTATFTSIVLVQDGNDWVSRDLSGHTADTESFEVFSPPAGELAWAMYSFYCGSHITKDILVSLQPGGKGIYVGYSDYTSGRWKFAGPYSIPAQPVPPDSITIDIDNAKLSPLGNMHVLVAVAGGSAGAVLEQLGISVHNWQDGEMNLAAQNTISMSLAEIAGRPAIAYVEEGGKLKFIRASMSDGSSWDAPVTVDDGPFGTLWSVSLADIAGRPAIAAQFQGVGGSLQFIRALDANGTNWPGFTTTVASSASDFYFGINPSLASLKSKTAIAFRGTDSSVAYAVNNVDASGAWFTLKVDDANKSATYPTLRLVNGHPAICFSSKDKPLGTNYLLRYSYSASLDGINSLDWTTVTIDDTNNAFGTGWLFFNWINDSFPAVVYNNKNSNRFKYAYATSANGLTGWVSQEVDPTPGSAASGLVTDKGLPAIIYRDPDGMGFMRAQDEKGSKWAASFIISPLSSGGTSANIINGLPALAYAANFDPNILAYTYRP